MSAPQLHSLQGNPFFMSSITTLTESFILLAGLLPVFAAPSPSHSSLTHFKVHHERSCHISSSDSSIDRENLESPDLLLPTPTTKECLRGRVKEKHNSQNTEKRWKWVTAHKSITPPLFLFEILITKKPFKSLVKIRYTMNLRDCQIS